MAQWQTPTEAGIVEKLLPSYGFIQCCERQARLFFHYSQFQGNIEHLKLGDPVEFQMTYDRRTGKPIASCVLKISSEAMMHEETSEERVSGFITTELQGDREGRVAYESRGECFFLPFHRSDVDDNTPLSAKDSVTFLIATDKSGNLRARRITLETPTPTRFEGVICTLKESFGFIERADVVREIFFHSSECKDFKDLALGDDVEFSIQTRNDKEVAVSVKPLEAGTVVFEDISPERYSGEVTKTFERSGNHTSRQSSSSNSIGGGNEPFPGKIAYKKNGLELEISYGERDVKGEFTIQVGDFVRFNIVTDRRDKLKHATNVELLDESFTMSGEHREQGYIASLRDSYGFIKCLNREGTRIYFRLTEMLDANLSVKLNDEVEFTVSPDLSSPGRLQAVRIKAIPDGTIMKNLLGPRRGASGNSYNNMNGSSESRFGTYFNDRPLIDLEDDATPQPSKPTADLGNHVQGPARTDSWSEILSQMQIPIAATNGNLLRNDDLLSMPNEHVEQSPISAGDAANDGKSARRNEDYTNNVGQRGGSQRSNGTKPVARGFVAALKESFGFIENEDHQTEVFFHYSTYEGNIQTLNLGHEVEYMTSVKGSKLSAEYVRKLTSGTLSREEVQLGSCVGTVVRSVRCLNPDQDDYAGIINVSNSGGDLGDNETSFEFGMTGLADIHDFVQKGDEVSFQVGICKRSGRKRAVNIKPLRNKHQATVDAIKGNFGFLSYDIDEGKKLFFHLSEVKNEQTLHAGDVVEFNIVHNQRSGKYSACAITKITEPTNIQRPERLITKMKSLLAATDDSPRIVLVRQPRGPDGTKGFSSRK